MEKVRFPGRGWAAPSLDRWNAVRGGEEGTMRVPANKVIEYSSGLLVSTY
jgi:hypothetical protein